MGRALLGFRVCRVYRARESRVQGLVRLRVLGLRLEGSISFSKLWGVGVGVERLYASGSGLSSAQSQKPPGANPLHLECSLVFKHEPERVASSPEL